MFRSVVPILAGIFSVVSCFAQSGSEKQIQRAIEADIRYLASDELDGRRTGTEGERKAADFIISKYRQLRIPAYGPDYRQPYNFIRGRELGNSTINIGGEDQKLGTEIFPFAFSGNGSVEGDILIDAQEQGSIWTLPLYASAEEAKDAHFEAEKNA